MLQFGKTTIAYCIASLFTTSPCLVYATPSDCPECQWTEQVINTDYNVQGTKLWTNLFKFNSTKPNNEHYNISGNGKLYVECSNDQSGLQISGVNLNISNDVTLALRHSVYQNYSGYISNSTITGGKLDSVGAIVIENSTLA